MNRDGPGSTSPDGNRYVTVPEGAGVPEDLEAEVTVIRQPVEHAYLAASSAMDLICGIGGLGPGDPCPARRRPAGRSTRPGKPWSRGTLVYAGKYSAPDYEMLLEESCGLAIEFHHDLPGAGGTGAAGAAGDSGVYGTVQL